MWEKEIIGRNVKAGLDSVKRIIVRKFTSPFEGEEQHRDNLDELKKIGDDLHKSYGVKVELVLQSV